MLFILIPSLLAAVTHNCDAIAPNVERYVVAGDTSDQIRSQLGRACSPSGDCFDAYINYYLVEPVRCSEGVYRVMMGNRIQMPELGQTRNPLLRTNFGIFERNLYQHEMNHLEHARRTCRYFVAELEKDTGNCTFAADRLGQIQSDGWNQARIWDTDYDSRTVHGMTEGACFGTHCNDQCQGCRERFEAANQFTPPVVPVTTTAASGVVITSAVPVPLPSITVPITTRTPTTSAVTGSSTQVNGSGTVPNGSGTAPINPGEPRPVAPSPTPGNHEMIAKPVWTLLFLAML
jgi:hypothetical protein